MQYPQQPYPRRSELIGLVCNEEYASVNPSTTGSGRLAFTLIELLVVIGIIAILGLLLYPALLRAKDAGMEAACLGNMRQIGAAIHSYAADTGVLPYSAAAANGTDWDNLLVRYGSLTDLKTSRQGCPKNRSKLAACFGYNYRQLGSEDPRVPETDRPFDQYWGQRRLSEVEKPSETIMLCDGHDTGEPVADNIDSGWPSLVYWDNRFWPTSETEKGGARGEFQPLGHNGRVNIIWVDGHGSSMKALVAWGLEKGQDSNSFYYFARRKNPSTL
jgi:prepilin-type N-terminal cleavage/methylation domain-containing protein/prepilin-type processing-associated H-X9-DG protein